MNYQKKYLKYKKKYTELKEQLGGAPQEITGNLTSLEANKLYKFKGINSCVWLVIKLGTPNDWGGLDFVSGKAIHFIDGSDEKAHHNEHTGLTENGTKVLTEINDYLNVNPGMEIQITYAITPVDGNDGNRKSNSTIKLIQILNTNFSPYDKTVIKTVKTFDSEYLFNSNPE